MTVLKGYETIIKQLLSLEVPTPSTDPALSSSRSSLSIELARSSRSSHLLTKIQRCDPKIIFRNRCTGCYKVLDEEGRAPAEAACKTKKNRYGVSKLPKSFLPCFNNVHYKYLNFKIIIFHPKYPRF